jgi:1-acyl-sn-glycerol-3-phosphate acyltransferase
VIGEQTVPQRALRFEGSRLATALLRLGGWRIHFDGLPSAQGVLVVYPHTSNWDFVVGILAKWSIGIPLRFWAKDSLFRVPVFGPWLRARGGVAVDRNNPQGIVPDMVRQVQAHKGVGRYFWLGVTPEGTRSARPGWRTGFYRVALQAEVPVGLARLDYGRREVRITDFIVLTGDEDADMARIARIYAGVRGMRPSQAAPVRFLEAPTARSDTMAR